MICKKCGAEIPQDSIFCPKCGKSLKHKISSVVSYIFNVVLLVICVIVFCVFYIAKQDYDASIKDLKSQRDILFHEVDRLNKEVNNYTKEKKQLENEKIELRDKSFQMLNEIIFYEAYAGIVVDDGTKKYHIYGCEQIPSIHDYSFWIYNTNEAERQGYYPCPTCHD